MKINIDEILERASEFCLKNKFRLTPPRYEILKIIVKANKPVGAYDILELLKNITVEKPNPPTVYRAIDFWWEHGFIHRIESLNAFVACKRCHNHKNTQFLICDTCRTVKELENNIHEQNNAVFPKFKTTHTLTEIHGTCANCQDNGVR